MFLFIFLLHSIFFGSFSDKLVTKTVSVTSIEIDLKGRYGGLTSISRSLLDVDFAAFVFCRNCTRNQPELRSISTRHIDIECLLRSKALIVSTTKEVLTYLLVDSILNYPTTTREGILVLFVWDREIV